MNNLKIIISSVFVLLVVIGLTSCKSASGAAKTQNTLENGEYRLIVSFFSPGNGIDRKAKDAMFKMIKEDYSQVSYETKNWGKEGEVDFAFKLTELNEKQQVKFVEKVKTAVNNSERVRIHENSKAIN